jgi:hypothetical protein
MSVDKEALFKPRLPEAEVELPDVGTFRVRGLSRGEALAIQETKGHAYLERKMVARALLDPVLTEAEVGRWQEASPAGELEPLTDKIQELSGMAEGAQKRAYAQFRGGPGDGDGVLPGDEAGDDGGPAAGADGQ